MQYHYKYGIESQFRQHLLEDEKAPATIEKYLRDLHSFILFAGASPITPELLVQYKSFLMKNHKPTSVNSMLSALNHFFSWCGWDLQAKLLKIQRLLFREETQALSREEYLRLLDAAKQRKNKALWLIIQTLCGTGIRVSELRFITVEAAMHGSASVQCKGKNRTILIPRQLQKLLLKYAKRRSIQTGPIFIGSITFPVGCR